MKPKLDTVESNSTFQKTNAHGNNADANGNTTDQQHTDDQEAKHSGKTGYTLDTQQEDEGFWELRLYVAGQTPNCLKAFENLKKICEQELKNRYSIKVIDLLENPQLAKGDQIIAIPTLVRRLPVPVKKIVGSLQDSERVLVGLDLKKR